MQTSILKVKGLKKSFKRFQLGPFNFTVEQGIVVGLVGANGSGKSTLFRLLMNIMKEDAGEIHVFGEKRTGDEWKQKVGFAGEMLGAYDFLTIHEIKNLISYWYSTWNEEQFENMIKRYRIDTDEKYEKCSKGTKKKVDFIFTLCHNPSLLLLDEPTAGVDIVSQRKMKEDLIQFMDDGEKSILLATHTAEEINQLCDEIIVLDSGQIRHSFNKDEIYENFGRLWISHVTDTMKNHPNVIYCEQNPPQIITNHLETIENILKKEQITINQVQRLLMEEVLEYLIEY
ncbi:ATP-binding cassette domain-containing protein [Oceanobacillus bengalensis]|nr:ABC transporter ATP-binding protein [Oceanobacillus bengalensis]